MTKLTGAQAIVKCLEREGIEIVFGIPGLYNMPIFDALYRHPTIQVVTVRHEQGAAFMADGYARATGKPAAIIPLPGPGLTNAMTGIGEAFYDSSPMLVMVTQVNQDFIDKEAGLLHEMTNQFEMLAPLTKHGERIRHGDEISVVFHRAMKALRNGRPRPVQIEIPRDIQVEMMDWSAEMAGLAPATEEAVLPPNDQIQVAAKALAEAERPLIYAGGGVISSGAHVELVQLAERLGALVLTTGMGVGSIPGDHPQACGVAWIAAADIRPLVAASDLFLAVGTRFNEGMTQGWDLPLPAETIRIDIDGDEIERNIPVKQKIVGDAKASLAAILEVLNTLGVGGPNEVHPALQEARNEYRAALEAKLGNTKPWMQALRSSLPRTTILCADMSLFWADMLGIFPIYEPRTMLFPWGFGTLGFALPEAMGAKFAHPDQSVVAICGDGAFLFTGTELATAIQYGLNIPIIIPNNNAYGMIKVQQRDQYDEQFMSVDLKNPDFVALAQAFGAYSDRVKTPEELSAALAQALAADRPTVIEIPWGWTWGNEVTMAKKYVQGKSIEEAQMLSGMTEIIKVGSNENVLGASPKAQAAINSALCDAHLYPDRHEDALLEKLSQRIGGGLSTENFISGNGSCDVLRMITQTFSGPGKKSLIAAPTFSMYELLTDMFGGEPVFVPLKDFTVDLDALANSVDDDVTLIFVCNPNNPTGTFITHEQAANFLKKLPSGVVTVFDEAYMEFSNNPTFPQITEFIADGKDVLVTRTFSKLHGLASLRVGYGFGRLDLMDRVRQHKLHFNSGRLAYLGAAAAVDDEDHIRESLQMVQNGRQYFYEAFDEIDIRYLPTQSNFIFLTDLPMDANFICDEAMKRGVILRPTDPFGLPGNIRITIARQKENERVVDVIQEIITS